MGTGECFRTKGMEYVGFPCLESLVMVLAGDLRFGYLDRWVIGIAIGHKLHVITTYLRFTHKAYPGRRGAALCLLKTIHDQPLHQLHAGKRTKGQESPRSKLKAMGLWYGPLSWNHNIPLPYPFRIRVHTCNPHKQGRRV